MTNPTAAAAELHLLLNGAPRRFAAPMTVALLLRELGQSGQRLAVERNGDIVPKSAHATTWLASGDRLELVRAVGGG